VSLTRLVLGDVLVLSAQAAATAVLLYFLLLGQRAMLHRWLGVMPSRPAQRRLLATLAECERDVRRFVCAMTLANLVLGAATGLLLLAIGLPHALLWAVAVAVLTFIPYVGPFLVFVLLTIAGSAAFGRGGQALLPALGFLALHALEANLISPWWMGYRLRLNRVAVFVAVLVFGWAWGVAGGFVAVPLLLVLRAVCRHEPGMRLVSVWLEAEDAPVVPLASAPGATAQVRGLPR
jgi:predicted PurR-regulated permease PerM